jgi:heptosyltransferase-2
VKPNLEQLELTPVRPDEDEGPTLVVQTAFLGDVVLTIPLLNALATRHGPVDVITTPMAASLLEAHPAVRTAIPFEKRGADGGVLGLLRLARRLRTNGYRRVYLPHRSWRTAAMALAAGIPERIGFSDSPAAMTYSRRVPRQQDLHETSRLLALAPGEHRVEFDLGLTPEDRAGADAWLKDHAVQEPFIAVAPGSVWGTKRWPGYPELAQLIGSAVVVVGGPGERELAASIVRGCPEGCVSAAGAITLRESAAIIERAQLLVTNDSAPLHIAGAVGTPVVVIFGPTVPAFGFGPLGPEDVIVERQGLDCRPCSSHGPETCPLGHHRCMNDIDVATVLRAVERVQAAVEIN